jgi:RNA polymerase sigma-70 factor (ECF subfamily)
MSFPTTHWSLLAQASLTGDGQSRRALEDLCGRYWIPVYQFIRCRGFSDVEAQDLSQEFMLHVLQKSVFERADRFQGRFRSFLIGALIRFLGDMTDRRNALKRGGGMMHVSYDAVVEMGEAGAVASVDRGTALFDREWALSILEAALNRVRAEYSATQRNREFAVLQHFLPGGALPPSYETAAGELGMSVPAFKSEVHRLRRRFRALVREEVAQTVSAPHEIDAEMAHLQQVLMDKGNDVGAGRET